MFTRVGICLGFVLTVLVAIPATAACAEEIMTVEQAKALPGVVKVTQADRSEEQ